MTLTLVKNFTTWCHCIISYYEQFELFDLEMTLTFDLQLNLTLTNTQHFVVAIMVHMRYLTFESPCLRYLTLK